MFGVVRSIRPPLAWLAAVCFAVALAGLAGPVLPARALAASRVPADRVAGPQQGPVPINFNRVNWSDQAGFGARRPAWFKDQFGVVHLEGALTQVDDSGKGANTLGRLPAVIRPERNVFAIVHSFNGTYADLEIAKNGEIHVIDPRPPAVQDYFFVSLEGISYRPSGSVTPIFLNRPTWIPAGSGAGVPSWYKDRSGVVHLQGAFSPGSPSCHVCAVGRLAQPVWPGREIDAIVPTFAGTFANLMITSDGQIFVMDAELPLVTDFRSVSLEGITFRAAGRTSPIPLNPGEWTASPDPKRKPVWFIDKAGIVHLQGVVSPAVIPAPNLVGTLPAKARPAHDIFTIVLTGEGIYADLEIARNGSLTLIDSRPPAVTSHLEVNLEGITYRR